MPYRVNTKHSILWVNMVVETGNHQEKVQQMPVKVKKFRSVVSNGPSRIRQEHF